MRRCFPCLLGMALCALAQPSRAEEPRAAYDPRQLPAFRGEVQLFTLTPRGDIDGMVLTDGTEVKTPPHLSSRLALIVHPGDAVTIHGLKAAKLPLVLAMSVSNDRDGRSVVDAGGDLRPGDPGQERGADQTLSGRVRMPLHGPRGEVDGVLLEDGTILRVPPADAVRFQALLKPGKAIAAEGMARVTVAGTVVEITALGAAGSRPQPLE